jgi:putative inorganic carbon (HCO3(-)) transporter
LPHERKTIFTHLADLEIWLVAAAVAFSVLRPGLLPYAVILALLFWPVRWIAYGELSRRTPVDIGLILLFITIPITIWVSALPQNTHPQVSRLLLGVIFFYSLVNWIRTPKRLSWIIAGSLFLGLLLAAGALVSVQWATQKIPLIPAAIYQPFILLVSDTIHPNVMAGSLVLVLPLAVSILLFAYKIISWPIRLIAALSLVAPAVILLLTQSRSALIAFCAVLILMVVLRWSWGLLVIPIFILALVLLVFLVGPDAVLEFTTASVSVPGADNRIEVWSRAIYAIQDFPFTGIGMGSFTQVVDLLYPFFLAAPSSVDHAHNIFLQVAVDLGLPGLIAWLSIFLVVILTAWQLYRFGRRQSDPWAAALGAGFLGCHLALCLGHNNRRLVHNHHLTNA